MPSLSIACRLSTNLFTRKVRRDALYRGLRTSTANLVAQNLRMPALSPTMTEGNIAKWNVKEGESFAAGDVLLEIETDKASMDVEAQDDGVLAKIIQQNGSKGIKVGTSIGVLAEAGDDLSNLEISENIDKASSPRREKPNPNTDTTCLTTINAPNLNLTHTSTHGPGPVQKQKYPLLPSVQHLIHLHGLGHSDIDNMAPSGPNNRLLKGDVLAYLGQIPTSYPSQLSSKIKSLSHLDLNNIKIKASSPPRSAKASKEIETKTTKLDPMVNLEQLVSLKSVHNLQENMKIAFGDALIEEDFITRATKFANKNLPPPRSPQATPDELFDSILGSKNKPKTKSTKLGFFSPTHTSAFSGSLSNVPRQSASRNPDIIDILSGKKTSAPTPHKTQETQLLGNESRIFRLEVPKYDEERAKLYLDRIKTVLENEPLSLVLGSNMF